MIERYSYYDFEIKPFEKDKWIYEIHGESYLNYDGIIESDEWFETEQEARFAAIGHICKLEDGEEPDYDIEPQSIDWEERRRLGE